MGGRGYHGPFAVGGMPACGVGGVSRSTMRTWKEPDMRIDVTGQHVVISPAIKAHAEEKAGKLTRFYDQVQMINVRVDHEPKHADNPFVVEVIVDVEHHDDFVARAEGTDVYVVIDQAVDKAARQLRDFKEKLKLGKRG